MNWRYDPTNTLSNGLALPENLTPAQDRAAGAVMGVLIGDTVADTIKRRGGKTTHKGCSQCIQIFSGTYGGNGQHGNLHVCSVRRDG